MTSVQRLMRGLDKICGAAALMVAGAWLLAAYLVYSDPQLENALKDARSDLALAFWAFYLVSSFLHPKAATPSPDDPPPRWSGVSVVIATGVAGAIFVARSPTSNSYLALCAIVAGTLVLAALVWRFATVHAAEIGEARFVNSGSR